MMRAAVFLLGLLLLTACGSGGPSPYGGTKGPVGVKLGKPYTVLGQYYEPRYDPNYREEGIASWYGPGFHGRMTASGEEFDTGEMTAAHRTLPMPSLVKVENLDNGRTAIVRVNDRGPFSKNRIIDLSSKAAEKLGVKATGTARVRLTYLQEETEQYLADMNIDLPEWMRNAPRTPSRMLDVQYAALELKQNRPASVVLDETAGAAPVMPVVISQPVPPPAPPPVIPSRRKPENEAHLPPPPVFSVNYTPVSATQTQAGGGYSVQTASFSTRDNAETHVSKLAGVGKAFVKEITVNGRQFFRVLLGPVPTSGEAQQMLEQARALGFTDARILVN
jgi:rare lipoprotein A